MKRFGMVGVWLVLGGCGGALSYDATEVGDFLDYRVTQAGGSSSRNRMQVVAVTKDGFSRRMTTAGDSGYNLTVVTIKDGAEYVGLTERHDASGTVSATTYAPAFLLLARDTTPGSSATTVSAVNLTSGLSFTSTREVTVDGTESVTVPAGTFTALKTTAHITDSQGGDTYNVSWWVEGIGRVKIGNRAAGETGFSSTWELTVHGNAPVP